MPTSGAATPARSVTPQDPADATRRTWLANERTWLAWVRTGLTALAVAIGVGKLIAELAKGPAWPYEALGVGYAVLGLALVAYGFLRRREVDDAVNQGSYRRPSDVAVGAFLVLTTVLGLATIVVILAT